MPKLKRKLVDEPEKKRENVIDFGPKEFCAMLKDPALAIKGLQKFCQVNQKFSRTNKSLDIIKVYISRSSECLEIFNCIESGKTSAHHVSVVFEALVQILLRTGNDLSDDFSEVGTNITRRLLQGHLRELYRGLSLKNPSKVVIPTLRLLTAMVVQGSECAYDVATSLELNGRVITTLSKYQSDNSNASSRTVRLCFVRFVLSFFISDEENKIKHVLQHIIDARGFVESVFHNLMNDSAMVVNLILTTMTEKVVLNPSMSKPNRVKLFGSHKLLHKISQLFLWDGLMDVDSPDGKESVHKLAFDFLHETCCSFRNGINFLDKEFGTGTRCGNHILLQFLIDLENSGSNKYAHKLVVEILKACPDLLSEYFLKSPLSFDPRPSPVWFENMKLLQDVYEAQPELPTSILHASKQQLKKFDREKLVAMTIPALLPSVFKRTSLKAALQNSKREVVIEIINLIANSIKKLQILVNFLSDVRNWKKSIYTKEDSAEFLKLLISTMSKLLPDVASVVKNWTLNLKIGEKSAEEGFLMLLSMYQEMLPESFDRCVYNFSNLLHHDEILSDQFSAKNIVYIVKILSQAPYKYKWFKKEGSKKSSFFQLLRIILCHYNQNGDNDVITHSINLIKKIAVVNSLVVNEDDSKEFYIWLSCLSEDVDSQVTLVSFFEDATANVARRPHRYVEKLEIIESSSQGTEMETSSEPKSTEWWESIPDVEIKWESKEDISDNKDEIATDNDKIQSEGADNISLLLLSCIEQAFHLTEDNQQDAVVIERFLVDVIEKLFYHQICFSQQRKFPEIIKSFYNEMDDKNKFPKLGKVLTRLCNWENQEKIKPKKTKITDPTTILEWFQIVKYHITIPGSENFTIFSKDFFLNDEEMEIDDSINLSQQKKKFDDIAQVLYYIDHIFDNKPQNFQENTQEFKFFNQAFNYLSEILFKLIEHSRIFEDKNANFGIFMSSYILQKIFLSDGSITQKITEKILDLVFVSSDVLAQPYVDKIFKLIQENIGQDLKGELCELGVQLFSKFQKYFSTDQIIEVIDQAKSSSDNSNLDEKVCEVINICLNCLIENNADLYLKISTEIMEYLFGLLNSDYWENILPNLLKILVKFPSFNLCADQNVVKWCIGYNDNNDVRQLLKNILNCNSQLRSYYIKQVCGIKNWKTNCSKMIVFPSQVLKSIAQAEHKKVAQKFKKCLTGNLDSCTDQEEIETYQWMIENNLLNSDKVTLLVNNIIQHLHQMEFIKQSCEIMLFILNCGKEEIQDVLNRSEIATSIINLYAELLKKDDITDLDFVLKLFMTVFNKEQFQIALIENWMNIVKTSLKCQFSDKRVLDLITSFVSIVYNSSDCKFLPSTLWSMITSHSNFLPIMFSTNQEDVQLKNSLVKLLYSVVAKCEELDQKDLTFLFGAYNATLSNTDQYIYRILMVFESKEVHLANQTPFLFGSTAIETYQSMKNVGETLFKKPTPDKFLACLESDLMTATLENFPLRRKLQLLDSDKDWFVKETNCYDPSFILTVLSSLLSHENLIDGRMFLKQGILSFLFMCLSSHCRNIRNLAARCIQDFHTHTEGQWFSEKNLALHSITCVRNSMKLDKNGDISKLSSIVTIFLSTLNKLLFQPNEHIFFALHRFLLVKPNLDLWSIPEFYSLFFSAGMEYKTERAWILKLLSNGMKDMSDYHTMEKRQILRILMCFYRSPTSDNHTRKLLLKVVESCCQIRGAVYNMINENGLFTWLLDVMLLQRETSELDFGADLSKRENSTSQLVDILSQLWSTLNPENKKSSYFSDKSIEGKKINRVSIWMTKQVISLCFLALENLLHFSNSQDQVTPVEVYENAVLTLDSVISYTENQYGGFDVKTKPFNLVGIHESQIIYKVGKFFENKEAKKSLDVCANILMHWKPKKSTNDFENPNPIIETIAWALENFLNENKINEAVDWLMDWVTSLSSIKGILPDAFTCLRKPLIHAFDSLSKADIPTKTSAHNLNKIVALIWSSNNDKTVTEYAILKHYTNSETIMEEK